MSDDKPTVIEALSAVMADVQAISKTQRNEQQKYLFRGIDAVMNAVGPSMRIHGVVVMPEHVETHYRDAQTTSGKATREVTLLATYRIYGPAGDSVTMQAPGESLDSGDKGTAKAMSVAYRTALLQALTIPTDEPDPDTYTYERTAEAPPAAPTQKQMARMFALATNKLGGDEQFKAWLAETVDYHGSRRDLNAAQVAWIIDKLGELPNLPTDRNEKNESGASDESR